MVQKKKRKNQIQKEQTLLCKKAPKEIYREKRTSILAHVDQIRPQVEYEGQNEEEISTIPSVNDLLEPPLQNKTPEDKIMYDQVGQNEFENSDEDKIMQKDNLDYSSVRDRSGSPRERNT